MSTQARGKETVERALRAALQLSTEEGPHGWTIQALAARAGASVGSLYHHFGSRDGVLFALYQRCLGRLLDAITAAVLAEPETEAGVRALVASYLRWVEVHPEEARVIYGVTHAQFLHAWRAPLDELAARVVAPLASWVAPRQARGELRPLPPALLEVALIGPAAEAARRYLGGGAGFSLSEASAALSEIVWQGVRGA